MAAREVEASRGERTRAQLMRAAEALFARDGLGNVSTRAIVAAAGQRNESALQYHFGGRDGLIAALHRHRSVQIRAEREALRARYEGRAFELRDLAEFMVLPAFRLAARDEGFRDYLKVFSHLVLFSSQTLTELLAEHERLDLDELDEELKRLLPGLDARLRALRFENAARFVTLALSRHARERGAFRGRRAEFFLSNLIDTATAMLAAEPSPETRKRLDDA